jgi:hypothetical protein
MSTSHARPAGPGPASPEALEAAVAAARRRLLDPLDRAAEGRALGVEAAVFDRFEAALDGVAAAARAAADAPGPEARP